MDSFEINKIAGAVLATCLALMALNLTAEAIFAPEKPAKPGFKIAVKTETPAAAKEAKAAPEEPIENLLASATVARGQQIARVCTVCHIFKKGGGNAVGPNLYGVVGRARATAPGFNYSDAMKKKGGVWTIDDLNTFLTNPRKFVPGTKMTFAGLPKASQRANVIAYLNSLSDNPKPLPVAQK